MSEFTKSAGVAQLEIRGLKVSIRTDEGSASILDNVNLTVPRGKIVGLVGESGCGKSTVGRAILGVLPTEASVDGGQIILNGRNLLDLSARQLSREVRGSLIGFIPQDPFLSFNPVFTVGRQMLEIMRWHGADKSASDEPTEERWFWAKRGEQARKNRNRICELLRAVQIADPERVFDRYPHQFSGGQRQRMLIAAALACRPELVIADEPTTALDVTTQRQLLALLRKLALDFDLSILFITHDFGVVAQLCDEVSVMYAGQTVESGATRDIIHNAFHPYSQGLMNCHPDIATELQGIPGTVPSPLSPPPGCRFNPRCDHVMPSCATSFPKGRVFEKDHEVKCHLYSDQSQFGHRINA